MRRSARVDSCALPLDFARHDVANWREVAAPRAAATGGCVASARRASAFVSATVIVSLVLLVSPILLVSAALAAPAADPPRTLDAISIEGEVAMPQVLFITAREPFRFGDTAHRIYLVGSQEVREMVWSPFPAWIGRTLAPTVSTERWNDPELPPREEIVPDSPERSQGRD